MGQLNQVVKETKVTIVYFQQLLLTKADPEVVLITHQLELGVLVGERLLILAVALVPLVLPVKVEMAVVVLVTHLQIIVLVVVAQEQALTVVVLPITMLVLVEMV